MPMATTPPKKAIHSGKPGRQTKAKKQAGNEGAAVFNAAHFIALGENIFGSYTAQRGENSNQESPKPKNVPCAQHDWQQRKVYFPHDFWRCCRIM